MPDEKMRKVHAPLMFSTPQTKQPRMGQMLHQLKSSLAEFAESDEVAKILKQMLQVPTFAPSVTPSFLRSWQMAGALKKQGALDT
jgi:hypothetical protein